MSEEGKIEEGKTTIKFLDTSIQRINTLNPKLIASATRVFDKCVSNGIPVYIIWGKRSNEQQEVMYRYGRSIPGKILTVHRPGFSAHNYGLALDFCLLFNTDLLSWEDCYPRNYWRNKWLKVVRFFEEEGWTSKWRGADFEPGHVENLMGNELNFYYEQENGNRNKWISNIREQNEDQELYI